MFQAASTALKSPISSKALSSINRALTLQKFFTGMRKATIAGKGYTST